MGEGTEIGAWQLLFWVILNIISTIFQFVALPLWISALPWQCADPFVVFQIAAAFLTAIFGVSVVVLSWTNNNRFFDFIRALTPRGIALICLAGGLFGLNGILVTISAPVNRTPPVISSTFPNICFILYIFVIWWLHRRQWLPAPKIKKSDFLTLEFLLFALMYVLCTYCTVVATNQHAALGGQVYWWIIFTVGIVLSYLGNQVQEIFFKSEPFDGSPNTTTNFLFCNSIAMLVSSLLLTPIDFIPGVNLTASEDIHCGYIDTLHYSFTGYGFLYNFLWVFGNFLSYVACVKTNTVNSGLTMLVNPVSTAIVLAISYPIKALTPDQGIIDVFFFFPTILTSIIMIFFYTIWYKGTRFPGRLIHLKGLMDRYDSTPTSSFYALND